MKKINIALMILSGFAVVGLTGCSHDDDKEPTVVNVTTPAPTTNNNNTSSPEKPKEPEKPKDCSGFAGTYVGTAVISGSYSAKFTIENNCNIYAEYGTNNGDGPASNLTSKDFKYNISWNTGLGNESGTCNYTSNSLSCNGVMTAGGVTTATKYHLTH